MEASAISGEVVERANELYWGTDRSVNQIAEDLDLSKGALYAMVIPFPSGLACPRCGGEVVHANRTARDRGRLECPTCEWDGTADEAGDGPVEDEPAIDVDEDLVAPLPASITSARMRTAVGGALLGAAVGLALVFWARRR